MTWFERAPQGGAHNPPRYLRMKASPTTAPPRQCLQVAAQVCRVRGVFGHVGIALHQPQQLARRDGPGRRNGIALALARQA